MPYTTTFGVTIRTVTIWYSSQDINLEDGSIPMSTLLAHDDRPAVKLLAMPGAHRSELAAPHGRDTVRCAGGRLQMLDLTGSSAEAASLARSRYQAWSADPTGRGKPPYSADELTMLRAGRDAYVTWQRLRWIVGDALVKIHGATMQPYGAMPQHRLHYVQRAWAALSTAAPTDAIISVAA
jgi:hypothetical protein